MEEPTALSLAAALLLASLQLAPRLLPTEDRSNVWTRRFTSIGGGFSVAFVFLHLLPELEEAGEHVAGPLEDDLGFAAHDAHLLALGGLVALYGMERLARRTSDTVRRTVQFETLAFAAYYASVGLVLWEQSTEGVAELVTFTVAVGVHFLVIDWGLARRRQRLYRRFARPLLSAMVLAGWGVGALFDVPEVLTGALTAFLAGGVVLVALKEELPSESQSRYGWFVAGVVLYTAMLTAMPA
ncbi:hypothetical protein ER308_01510 [Egibacter rhizosphaerae]|uniref:ZIP family metal transporter n=1 Tax=Egibacter rhizosphaerae TaxID=1670831 RepID=A0A411YB25_9ACTN|nr:hypothetical protein [Egibacter rhizosphaerae]QBI18377.1 hypothetical protein ER308_01510 [Egibacter rhizosphaerae]